VVTIESYAGRRLSVTDWEECPSMVLLSCGEHVRAYDRRELEAALDVDPDWREKLAASNRTLTAVVRERDELKRELGYAEMGSDQWRTRAEAAEAKLAHVEAVAHEFYKVRGDWATDQGARALKARLTEALADPEPFMLPTEAGVRFEARYGGRDAVDEFLTVSYGGGSAVAYVRLSTAKVYSKSQVMEQFTGHRVLDGDA
jgi:hypothetical protein